MTRSNYLLALLAMLAALAIAGCGSSDDSTAKGGETTTSSSEAAKPVPTPKGGAEVLTAAEVPGLGPVLVESEGFTVYVFHGDKGIESSCYGACAETWPPVRSDADPQARDGAWAPLLGQIPRKDDGLQQVLFGGHPLYTYSGDKNPGEANGHDIDSFGAEWYALKGNGQEAGG